jgi:hypothetical protein
MAPWIRRLATNPAAAEGKKSVLLYSSTAHNPFRHATAIADLENRSRCLFCKKPSRIMITHVITLYTMRRTAVLLLLLAEEAADILLLLNCITCPNFV